MKNYIKYLGITLFISIIYLSCSKNDPQTEINIAYKMLAEKSWYLESIDTVTNNRTSTNSYFGQPTYFINFLNNKTTRDSDGFSGNYSVSKSGTKLTLSINTNSSNGNPNNYNYEVISLGDKNMILSFTQNNRTIIYYYNTVRQ
jgi:hypothetical protein